MKNDFIRKMTSRKFIIAVITAIVGVITMFVGDNETVNVVAGALMTIVPTVVYCITEGFIDAKSVEATTNAIIEAAEKLGADDSTIEVLEQIGTIGEILTDEESE